MSEATVLQLISTGGAAVAFFWVVWQFIKGNIHSTSAMKAKDEQIHKLEVMNKTVVDQLAQTNKIFERAIERGYTTTSQGRP